MAITLGALLALAAPAALAAQAGSDPRFEGRLLREAASREARGDLPGAEDVLRTLLDEAPTSAGGLFALERVLRARGRLASILPVADRYLEAEPDAPGAWYLKLRVLAELDSMQALDAEAEAWMRARPGAPEPYREIARLYGDLFGPERALAVLQRGADAVADPAALSPELGDLLMRLDRPQEAVRAWSRAVGPEGDGGQPVLRRLRQIEGDRRAVAAALVDALAERPGSPGRKRVAVEAAVDAGLVERAGELAEEVADVLAGEARRDFLENVAGWAEGAGAPDLRLWAYARLRSGARDGAEARALDLRIAEAALAVGDTVRALEARTRLAGALPEGSPERRRVVAEIIRMEASSGEADALRARLDAFRREFADAPETDGLAARVAAALQSRGRESEAARVLEGVTGPRSALERAYLHLESGDVALGRQALLGAVGGLPPGAATDVIQLAGLLERLAPPAARAVAAAAVAAHRGRGADAAATLEAAVPGLPEEDRPRVLAHAARLADAAGDADGAARLRTLLVREHAGAPEAAEATLALARWHAGRDEAAGLEEAARLLEELILSRPESPMVPAARRELQRVRGRIP